MSFFFSNPLPPLSTHPPTHPSGGGVIKFLVNGGDASDAFHEFHSRSPRAQKMLRVLKSREAVPEELAPGRLHNGRDALARDYAALREEFKAEGMFEPSPVEVVYRNAELVVLHAVGIYLLSLGAAFVLPALVILGIAQGRCGWLMHEGGHYSLTGQPKVDRALQIVLYGVGCGMSAGWWRSQHNRHHATPQKLQHDVDLDTLPLVAFNSAIAARTKSPVIRTWLRLQAALFIPVSCVLVALGWQFYLHPRYVIRKREYAEGASMLLRYYLAFGVVLAEYSWAHSIALYLTYNAFAAAYIFTNFALSHTHLPVSRPGDYLHWVEYASSHTTNITSGPICNWWMAYLNFQIEHHLFPTMPQFRHPIIAPRVRAFFEKHGLVYDVRDYFPCLKDTLLNLHTVGQTGGQGAKVDPEIKSE
jgi:fatty acid desaturase